MPMKLVRRLRHFGLDYMTLNLGLLSSYPQTPKGISFLNSIFDLPHNTTNASEYNSFVWGASSEEVNLQFSSLGKDQVIYVYRGEHKIMSLRKISSNSNMPPTAKGRYQFQINFYGAFFALVRSGDFIFQDYWHPFLSDIQDGHIRHSLSRVDICADIENADVKSIQRSIKQKGRMKASSELEIDDLTGIPETVYFGSKSKDWKARIYNKTKEISAKHKGDLYADYVTSDCITRVEIELHSKPCQEYSITLNRCLDLGFLLGVYEKHLSNRVAHWGILRFIKSELQKTGCKPIPAERIKLNHNQLSKQDYFRRTVNSVKECARRSGFSAQEVLKEIELILPVSNSP